MDAAPGSQAGRARGLAAGLAGDPALALVAGGTGRRARRVAGLCAYGTWEGTTPLVIVAGIALFIAALDAIEPLAQEVDHPDRTQGVPIKRGEMYVRHLAVPVVVMALAGLIGLGAARCSIPSRACSSSV